MVHVGATVGADGDRWQVVSVLGKGRRVREWQLTVLHVEVGLVDVMIGMLWLHEGVSWTVC